MSCRAIVVAGVLVTLLVVGGPAFGRGGVGGGGVGGRMGGIGGGTGGRIGSMGGARMGGLSSGARLGGMGSGMRAGGLGGLSSGRIGSGSMSRGGLSGGALSAGGIRMPSQGFSARSAPNLGSSRSGGGLNLGSSLSWSPGINLSRPGNGNITARPAISGMPALGLQNGAAAGARNSLGIQPQAGSRLGNILGNANGAAASSRNALGDQVQPGSRLGNILGNAMNRAGISGQSNVNPGNILSRAGNSASAGRNITGRVSANDVGQFLSLNGRQPGANISGLARGNQAQNLTNLTRGGALSNLNASQVSHIRGSMQSAFNRNLAGTNLGNTAALNSVHAQHWNNWAGNIHAGGWNPHQFHNCFNNNFWAFHHCYFPFRHCYYWWGGFRPWTSWWGCPTWNSCVSWFPSWGWSSPYYYDYGYGGNVVYNSGYVYVNDQPVATADDYASSAYDLATVPQPANPDEVGEWLPLGTFAVAAGEDDKNPSRVLQLAVDKEGIIAGTMYNRTTDQTYPVQGRVDKTTQRVAFTIGESREVVLETGIYNLTQQQTPLLAHGEGRTETYLLMRLDPPKPDDTVAPPAGNSKTLVP